MSEKIQVSNEEARLIGIYRALQRAKYASEHDASDAAAWLPATYDMKDAEKNLSALQMHILLDGYVAGLSAARLMQSDVTPQDLLAAEEEQPYESTQQTGIDPVTEKVR